MSHHESGAVQALDPLLPEAPILAGDGFEVFEGWGALTPEQVAECEQAEVELRDHRAKAVPRVDVLRVIGELRLRQGG